MIDETILKQRSSRRHQRKIVSIIVYSKNFDFCRTKLKLGNNVKEVLSFTKNFTNP